MTGNNNDQPIVDVTNSAISGFVERTVSCIVTPSDNANFARSRISKLPRNTPENKKNTKLRLFCFCFFL